MANSAPMTLHSSGMKVATGAPTLVETPTSNIQGGLLNAGAEKTAASIRQQASDAKAGGVTMRGGGTTISVPPVPEGGTIPGVSFAGNHANLVGIANQLKAGAVYDNLGGTTPYKVGGRRRRTRRRFAVDRKSYNEEPAIGARRKHKRKTKKNVRRRNHRNSIRHRRKLLRSSSRTGRSKRT